MLRLLRARGVASLSRVHPRSAPHAPRASMASQAQSKDKFLFYTDWANAPLYRQLLEARGLPLVTPDEVQDWDAITMAAVWKPAPGLLARCKRLKAAMSLGAGVDHIMGPGQVPAHVPILRIVDPVMAQRMATWVVWGVITWQRRMEDYAQAQLQKRWDQSIEGRNNMDNHEVRVGVMGFGLMGKATAQLLVSMGYQVSAWSRTPKQHEVIKCYHGDQLNDFVSRQDVLVVLLPLTPDTEGIINGSLFSLLPPGACVINGARGKHVNESDLVEAMRRGQVRTALLDVFSTEPLPTTSPLWSQPGVRITPHVASMTTLSSACDQIAANWRRIQAGDGPISANLVSKEHGY